jgi:hypothetical protein
VDTCACYSVHFIFEHHVYGLIFGKPPACEKRQPTGELRGFQSAACLFQRDRLLRFFDEFFKTQIAAVG